MMGKVVGYGCVASSQHSVRENRFLSEEEAEWRKNTKVAEEFKKLCDLFLPSDCVQIDVIGGTYRCRHQFEKCLKEMGFGDSIVITSLSSLGLNNKELLHNYKRIYEKRIGLLLPDYTQKSGLSRYSTTNYSFSPISISSEEFEFLCFELSSEDIKSNRGRKKVELSDEFKDIYWLYERYVIDPITACKNMFYNISKNTFRRLAEQYEASDEYNVALEYQEKLHNISRLPKRFGVINSTMEAVIYDVSILGVSFNDACKTHGVSISEIQFQRLMLKFYCPKGATLKKTFELRDFELIESLQPTYHKT